MHFSSIHLEASSSCLLPAREASSAARLLLSSATLVFRPSTWVGGEEDRDARVAGIVMLELPGS